MPYTSYFLLAVMFPLGSTSSTMLPNHRTHTTPHSDAPHPDDTPEPEGLLGTWQKHTACSSPEHTPPPPLACSHHIPCPLHSLPHCSLPRSYALNRPLHLEMNGSPLTSL